MDETLLEYVRNRGGESKVTLNFEDETLALLDDFGQAAEPQKIKPLAQLYGKGTGLDSVEFGDDRFLPLLMAIEEAILDAHSEHPTLKDSDVLFALDRLCMSPETIPGKEPLAAAIQFSLRFTLSLNDFSRQDVRLCLRKVKQSATHHNKKGGMRGYLNFIRKMLRQR